MYIPTGRLRHKLMEESHNTQLVGHPGRDQMLALMSRVYYWPQMETDIEAFFKSCLVYEQDKAERSWKMVYFTPTYTRETMELGLNGFYIRLP